MATIPASLVPKLEPEGPSEATPTGRGPGAGSIHEPVDFVDLEERILQLCAGTPKGITDEAISRDQPLLDTERRMKALQRLLSQVGYVLREEGGSKGSVREGWEREDHMERGGRILRQCTGV